MRKASDWRGTPPCFRGNRTKRSGPYHEATRVSHSRWLHCSLQVPSNGCRRIFSSPSIGGSGGRGVVSHLPSTRDRGSNPNRQSKPPIEGKLKLGCRPKKRTIRQRASQRRFSDWSSTALSECWKASFTDEGGLFFQPETKMVKTVGTMIANCA